MSLVNQNVSFDFISIQGRRSDYRSCQKYVPVELLTITVSKSRRMISFRSGSCLSNFERVKENIFEVFQIRR